MTYVEDHGTNPCTRCGTPPGMHCEHDEQMHTTHTADGIGTRRCGSAAHVAVWNAVHGYVRACGGNPDCISDDRMTAVAKIEQAIDARVAELNAHAVGDVAASHGLDAVARIILAIERGGGDELGDVSTIHAHMATLIAEIRSLRQDKRALIEFADALTSQPTLEAAIAEHRRAAIWWGSRPDPACTTDALIAADRQIEVEDRARDLTKANTRLRVAIYREGVAERRRTWQAAISIVETLLANGAAHADLIKELHAAAAAEGARCTPSTATPDVTHPMQPVVMVDGVVRFKRNAVVRYLLDHGGIDLNQLALLEFSADDRMQFAQLIGYSVTGYSELSYVTDLSVAKADWQVADLGLSRG